jgi:hypothetical protein
MRVFGTKRVEPTNEDRAAAARLSAVAARFKPENPAELTEAAPDPLGEPSEEIAEPDSDE